jgi:hypothetical protein
MFTIFLLFYLYLAQYYSLNFTLKLNLGSFFSTVGHTRCQNQVFRIFNFMFADCTRITQPSELHYSVIQLR